MTDQTVTPAEPADQPVTYTATVAELRRIADALESLNALPAGEGAPWLTVSLLLNTPAGVDEAAVALFGKAAKTEKNGSSWYHVLHGSPVFGSGALAVQATVPSPHEVELERLRAEVAELRGAQATTKSLVADETPEHYEKRGWVGEGPGSCGVECACGLGYDGFDSLGEASKLLAVHIVASVDPDAAEPAQPVRSARLQALLWKRDVTTFGEAGAMELTHEAALNEDNDRAKAAVIASLRPGEAGRVVNPRLAHFLAQKEHARRSAGTSATDAVARQMTGQGPGGPS